VSPGTWNRERDELREPEGRKEFHRNERKAVKEEIGQATQ
jgi:hypothetical protein